MSRGGRLPRILVVQLARFGDFLQTTPMLSALKASDPDVELSVLVDAPQEPLARANPDVDRVLAVDLKALERTAAHSKHSMGDKAETMRRRLGHLAELDYDRIINLNTSRMAALISALPRAARREGPRLAPDRRRLIPAPWAVFIMNLMTQRRLIRFNLVDLLAGYADIDGRPAGGLTYPVSERSRRMAADLVAGGRAGPLVGFQLGSRHESRQWPPERFAALARLLIRNSGARIVLLGTAPERDLGRRVIDALNARSPEASRRVTDLMGQTSIDDLGGALSLLDLLVTTDTGTMHLAAAVGTPILALFMGPAFCHETGPYGAGHVILQVVRDCSPCMEHRPACEDFPCRESIRPEGAFQAAHRLLTGGIAPLPDSSGIGPGVNLYVSARDRFGVVYRPMVPAVMDETEALALAYREAGRRFIRPAYRPDEDDFQSEIDAYVPAADFNLAGVASALGSPAPRPDEPIAAGLPDLGPLFRISAALKKRGDGHSTGRLVQEMQSIIRMISNRFPAGERTISKVTGGRAVMSRDEPWTSC